MEDLRVLAIPASGFLASQHPSTTSISPIVRDIRSFALHVTSEAPFVRPVQLGSRKASAIVVACQVDGLPPCVVIVDCEGIGRAATGVPVVGSILEITEWCTQNLPSAWVAGDGPLWVCMNGVSNGCFVLRVKPGRVLWTRMRWPDEPDGSLSCFIKAAPAYATAAIRVLDELICAR